ncbi:hypothetical protein Hamer_G028829 [Homarus americanus]|uniref:Uncharacterized protein n=1 Tax=Homarus americanus TaxID=6706 RepID=A0A8J5JCW4_HOMAM|nr:hypothetical protein Hamer_G028829 [Homarus americanus]
MKDLGMKRVAAKFVPRFLSREQKEFCAEVAEDLLQTSNNDPYFLKQVITKAESWVYGYDPETKAQSSLVEVACVFTSKEGTAKSEQHQGQVDCVF